VGGADIDIIESEESKAKKFQEDNGLAFVSESFFNIFDFKNADLKWIYGDSESALSNPNSVVLTASLARKFFGTENTIGKSILINKGIEAIVTGVISDFPANTNFPFTMICSYATVIDLIGKERLESWGSVSDSHQTYIILPEGMTKQEMENEITRVHEAHVSEELASFRKYPLQPLNEVHQDSRFGNYQNKFTSMKSIWILAAVGCFLLIMISINFVNTSIARSISRSKEIGLRRVIGGNRLQIIIQFFTETFALTLIATILAVVAAELLKVEFQNLFEFQIQGLFITQKFSIFIILSLLFIITLLAGIYPAIVQSGFTPLTALKNTISSRIGNSMRISNALVLVQFTFTIMLITGTLIVMKQIRYFNTVDLGFKKDAVINVHLPNNDPASLSSFKNQLLSNASIENVSYSSTLPSGLNRNRGYMDIKRKGAPNEDNIVYEYQSVDTEYLKLYDIRLEAGENLRITDTSRSVLINHTLMRKLGFQNSDDCIGAEVEMGQGFFCTIAGVLHDFHNQSLKEDFGKIAMVHNPNHFSVASIKLNTTDNKLDTESLQTSINQISASWVKIFPDNVFDYEFLDKNIEAFYKDEKRFAKMFQYLSIIFLGIGCLGIYGLISFIINKKMSELAIRKILGASISNITGLLLKNYIILLVIASLLSAPFVHYFMNKWLDNFAYHIHLSWWLFILPPLLVLTITLITVGKNTYQAIKANPSDTLRQE
jgi:putative ABC transport system permease protein